MIVLKYLVFVVFLMLCVRLSEFIYDHGYLTNKLKDYIRREKHVKR